MIEGFIVSVIFAIHLMGSKERYTNEEKFSASLFFFDVAVFCLIIKLLAGGAL